MLEHINIPYEKREMTLEYINQVRSTPFVGPLPCILKIVLLFENHQNLIKRPKFLFWLVDERPGYFRNSGC